MRKLTLDLVIGSFPKGHPPSHALVELLKLALSLPATHEVISWPLTAGKYTDRGKPDHEARVEASLIDVDYFQEHGKPMPLRTLQRRLKAELGRAPDRKSLRTWRKSAEYWCWNPPVEQVTVAPRGKQNFLPPRGK